MGKIVGCLKAHELSMTQDPANIHAEVIMLKGMKDRAKTTPAPQPAPGSEIDMTAEELAKANAAAIAKTAAWTDEVRKHYIGLNEETQVIFLAKSLADQVAEVDAAKAVADKAKADADAAAAASASDIGKSVADHPLMKSQALEIESLKSRLAEQDLEKRLDTEFAGFPGDPTAEPALSGRERAKSMLEAARGMPEAARLMVEDSMKSQIAMAKKIAKAQGIRTEDATGGAMEQLKAKARDVAKAKGISEEKAFVEVTSDKANAALCEQANQEELSNSRANAA